MNKTTPLLLFGLVGWFATAAADAAPYVYPARGQSSSRQAKDEADCYVWAQKKTGFDPASPAPPPVSGKTEVTGSGARLAGGAAGAVVAGGGGGNAATGALVGAVGGGLGRRGRAKSAANKENEGIAQERQAATASFDQAGTACLTGRGYSVR